MDSQITFISKELKKLHIKPRSVLQKKYLIDSTSRKNLREFKKVTIGLIPFRSITNPVFNPKKELFIHQTHILTLNQNLISFQTMKQNSYLNKILKYIENNLYLEIPKENINKILDIENSKVQLYTINLQDIDISHILNTNNNDSIIKKLENLSLQNKYTFVKSLDFYNHLEVKENKKELYRNIVSIRQNKSTMQKVIPLNISDNIIINFKYNLIYQRLY